MKKIFMITMTLTLLCSASAQDTSIANYFPTTVGNEWFYQCSASGSMCLCNKLSRTRITDSLLLNGKIYYVFQSTVITYFCEGMDPCSGVTFDTSRIDPITGNILRYSQTGCSYSPHEIMYDSLRARLNDTINAQCAINSPVRCLDTISVLLFGQIRSRKSFGEPFHEGFGPHSYVRGIGFSGASAYGQSCSVTISIKGCVLNGFVYGDTSFIVGVKQISTEVPEEFSLSQNYPNPFNPTTKIKFSIPLSRGVPRFTSGRGVSVKLTIYDLLGREVATLVNEQLKPGTYEVEWDGTNYPSGVYFYKLTAGDALAPLSSTKKMVLLK